MSSRTGSRVRSHRWADRWPCRCGAGGADCTGGRHFASAGIRGDGSGGAYWQTWETARK